MDQEDLIRLFFKANGLVSVLILSGIFAFLFFLGISTFQQISLGDFFGPAWNPTAYGKPVYGILGLLFGSILVVLTALLIAVPLGIFTAVYLSEMASSGMREFLKPVIEMIASIPSVVLGLVGLLVLAPMVAALFGLSSGLNALTASVVVAVMLVPTIASLCEDVFSSVPANFRAASYALGATPWHTIKRVVLPASLSGVFAAVMLALGRAVGETMAVLMVAGNALAFPGGLLDPVRPLTANIAIEVKEVVVGSLHYHALFAMGLVLFLLTFLVNVAAEWVLWRHQKRLGV